MATYTGSIYVESQSTTLLGTFTAEEGICYSIQDLLDSAGVTMPSDTVLVSIEDAVSYSNLQRYFPDQIGTKNIYFWQQSKVIYLSNAESNFAVYNITYHINGKAAFSGRCFSYFNGDRSPIEYYMDWMGIPQIINSRTFDHAVADGVTYTSLDSTIRAYNGLHIHLYYTGNDMTITPYIFTNGAWHEATPTIVHNGAWGEVTPNLFYNGSPSDPLYSYIAAYSGAWLPLQ